MRIATLALLSLLALAGCAPAGNTPPPRPASAPPDILVIVLDACRPDHLGCYGYERETSPAIDALARDEDAVLFRRHYVQGAWTKASTASLFSGLFAFQHGVLLGEVMTQDPQHPGEFLTQVLDERLETMAERLGRLGYYTVGVAKSRHLVPELGFSQGFDEYFSPDDVSSDEGRVSKFLESIRDSPVPMFGYLHLSGCHHPFPPGRRDAEFLERYGAGIEYDEQARRPAGVDFTDGELKHRILDGDVHLNPDDVEFLNLVYDAELRHTDRQYVARLIDELKQMGRYDDALIVVTADHGEELYEHGGYAHGHALWDEVIHVPMVVKFPKGKKPARFGHETDEVTQSVDLLPSFLALAGAPPADDLPGTDIFDGPPRGFAFSQTKQGWALVHDGHKLIREGDRSELFDLVADPEERHDLAAEDPQRVAAMQQVAEALQSHLGIGIGSAPTVETELDPDAVEELRSLGYLR